MKSIMLLAVATTLSVAATAYANNLPPEVQSGVASYVSGGIGANEANAMREAAPKFPLTLMMSQSKGGNFVTDVDLRIQSDNGQAVLHSKSAGPIVLVQVPSGRYQITAQYDGKTLTRNIDVNTAKRETVYLNWPA